ncbi:DUF3710 domain-containing protein [Nocardia abscessus]|uniref:DUF3710 domain-containing protein n=1 Tax=Nocardia abscessus TaxID=120957 RepID=UPI001894E68D|nr:DUF3710 domain-containing protein [Nocardia abscessus]MBF6335738.1 DUF3710 domain-containing protein [Nocardia abscessus]
MFGKRKKSGRAADDRYDDADDYADYEPEYEAGYAAPEYDDEFYDDAPTDERSYEGVDLTVDRPQGKPGPYDYDEVAELLETVSEQRLDLGSVLLPVPPGGQLQVEMTPEGQPQAVHLATEHGRITVAAYAAPKTSGQWRLVAADLADSLRKDGARVSIENGPWGRELLALTEGADLRFIGVDGYRWMVRLVAAGPSGAANDGSPLVKAARAILSETVVRRGEDPLPVREPLPVVLPQQLSEQLAAAHQQQVEAQQQAMAAQAAAQTGAQPVVPRMPQGPRRGADGSAMQQLGLN